MVTEKYREREIQKDRQKESYRKIRRKMVRDKYRERDICTERDIYTERYIQKDRAKERYRNIQRKIYMYRKIYIERQDERYIENREEEISRKIREKEV